MDERTQIGLGVCLAVVGGLYLATAAVGWLIEAVADWIKNRYGSRE